MANFVQEKFDPNIFVSTTSEWFWLWAICCLLCSGNWSPLLLMTVDLFSALCTGSVCIFVQSGEIFKKNAFSRILFFLPGKKKNADHLYRESGKTHKMMMTRWKRIPSSSLSSLFKYSHYWRLNESTWNEVLFFLLWTAWTKTFFKRSEGPLSGIKNHVQNHSFTLMLGIVRRN